MNDQERYALYDQAKKTGGPCEICGWKDGNGVRTCFYSKELGIVTHQNSSEGVMASMNEAQRHLYQLRQELVYISEETREKHIQQIAQKHLLDAEKHRRQYPDRPFTRNPDGTEISDDEWIANYRASQMKTPLATEAVYTGWMQEPWWIPISYSNNYTIPVDLRGPEYRRSEIAFTAYMTHVYEPHSCGKGHQYGIAPYHLGCTGCDTEIKLWEHGVDYDIG